MSDDNRNLDLYTRKEQLAFAMGVFEMKMKYEVADDDEIWDEFFERLYEIGEYDIHHRVWMQEYEERINKKCTRDVTEVDFYEEYENACEKFRIIESFIERGCVAI